MCASSFCRKLLKSRLFSVIFGLILFVGLFYWVPDVFAQQPPPPQADLGLQFAQGTGLSTTDIRVTIARIIRIAFGLLGTVAVVIMLYGGFIWMTSGGDQNKISTAKKILINGAIGLAIILAAFGITEFIIRTVLGQSGNGSNTSSSSSSGSQGGAGFGGGALGRVIQAHYPDRGAIDVPRNTKVIITFAEKIKDSTIFDSANKNQINFSNIKIYKTKDAKAGGLPPADAQLIKDVTVSTNDQLTYAFRFANYLGSPSENVGYTVYLGPGIEKNNGQSVFGGPTGSYVWEFTTGTTIDLTPPQVESVSPIDLATCPANLQTCAPRNEIIQINFNEAIDPTTVTGLVPGFSFIRMKPQVSGEFLLSNQYKTVTFIPSSSCGNVSVNSCGDKIFCLPGKALLEVTLVAAQLDPQQQGTAQAALPYTGIVDVAGNSLDGQGGPKAPVVQSPDGKAVGAPNDNYVWEFHTNDDVDVTPPKIVSVKPILDESNVALDTNVEVIFTKKMLASSLWGGVAFYSALSTSPAQKTRWPGAQTIVFGEDTQKKIDTTRIVWKHYDLLYPSTAGAQSKKIYYYYPELYSTLKDTRQNCFKPAEGPTQSTKGACEALSNNRWKSSKVGTYPSCDLSK